MQDAKYELPYEGAKEMLLVEDVDNAEFFDCVCRSAVLPHRSDLFVLIGIAVIKYILNILNKHLVGVTHCNTSSHIFMPLL